MKTKYPLFDFLGLIDEGTSPLPELQGPGGIGLYTTRFSPAKVALDQTSTI